MERYPRATLVTLTESFRSYQGVLDQSHAHAASHIPASHGAHAPLTATRTGNAAVSLLVAPDPLAERDQVAGLVEAALAEGVAPHEIAVIASRNASVDRFSEHLAGRGIPTLRAGDVSLSSRPLMRSVLALMRAVGNPLDTSSLRESVLAPWWPAGLSERASFLTKTRDSDLLSQLSSQFPKIGTVVSELQAAALGEAPLVVFSRLLTESGARGFVLGNSQYVEDVSMLRKLFGYLEEIVIRDPGMRYAAAIDALGKAHEHGLEWVKSSALTREGRVTVITAHKAKGMEFERVFIVGLTEGEWERGRMNAKIPSPIDMRKNADDAAKQFYVALTRAKDAVTFSYAEESLEGRERKPSAFIPEDLERIEAVYDPLPLLHHDTDAPELVRTLTRDYLTNEGLSPSALQEYLDSPPTFFARRVLRLKEPEQASMVIGTAVHAGIAAYLETADEDRAFAALEAGLMRSLLPRNQAYDAAASDARARLHRYIEEGNALGTASAIEKTYRMSREFAGETVNLSGKIDAVLERDGASRIIDFKTSTTVRGKEENYLLQLAFYDYLLRENGEKPSGACIVQVRADGVEEFPIPLTDSARAEFLATLEEAVPEMLSGKWRAGASTEPSLYDDLLKLFA